VGADDSAGLGDRKIWREGTANRPLRGCGITAGSNGNGGQETGSRRIQVIQLPKTLDSLGDSRNTGTRNESMIGGGIQARALSAIY
jgi:hypothetical protein